MHGGEVRGDEGAVVGGLGSGHKIVLSPKERRHQELEFPSGVPVNSSSLIRFSTVRPGPLASWSIKVDGTSSQLKPLLPKASLDSQTIIEFPSIVHPLTLRRQPSEASAPIVP